MCDFVKRWFTPPGTGGAEAEMEMAQARENTALTAQQQAIDQAKASADSDSEQSQLASEDRLRKLLAAGSFGAATKSDAGPASIGTRTLFGA